MSGSYLILLVNCQRYTKSNHFSKQKMPNELIIGHLRALRVFRPYLSGTKFIETEFTQLRVFFAVKPSPMNTCPK